MFQAKHAINNKRQIRHKRLRHFLILCVLFSLICFIGFVTIKTYNQISPYTLSKSGEGKSVRTNAEMVLSSAGIDTTAVTSSADSTSSKFQSSSSSKVPSSSQISSLPNPVSSALVNSTVYQSMYPALHTVKQSFAAAEKGKIVYLTFDDGPSNLTKPLLDVLDHYQVKATFFLVGKTGSRDLQDMKDIVERGHAIGVHSYTHQFRQIYKSPAAFLDDFAKMHDLILKTTGVDTHIYRYAGGSINDFDRDTAKAIITEMNRRGYTYYDWNVSSEDAVKGTTASGIYSNVIHGVHRHTHSVILCHNTSEKSKTLSEMPKIIETLLKEGYKFKTLDETVDNAPYIFQIPN